MVPQVLQALLLSLQFWALSSVAVGGVASAEEYIEAYFAIIRGDVAKWRKSTHLARAPWS
jgi:hypothetical protein